MAVRKIASQIELQGEQQYKQAVGNINKALGVLDSEMAKVNAQFSRNSNSVEALQAKNEVLNRKLLTQRDKVAQLRDALQRSAEAYGESDRRTMDWQRQLNNAEAAEIKLTQEIQANTEAIDKSNSSLGEAKDKLGALLPESKGLGDAVQTLAGKFGVQLPQGLTTSLNSTMTFSAGSVAAFGAVTAAVVALEKAEREMMELTKESASWADTLLTDSSITGLTTDTLQEMAYASELIDVSTDTITSSMTMLTRNMGKARDGSADLQEAFSSLGVSFVDSSGQLRDRTEVFYDLIDALGEVANETERDEIAMKLLGKSAQDLNPLIEAGSGKMRELAEEAHNTGYVMSTEQLKALGDVDDAYQRLQLTQEKMRNHMAAEFAPTAELMYTKWGEFIDTVGDKLVKSRIIENLGSILDSTVALISPLMQLAVEVIPLLDTVLDPLAGTLAWIADTADAAIALLTFDTTKWSTALGWNPNEASHLQRWMYGADYKTAGYTVGSNVYDPSTGWYVGNGYNATGNSNFPGGVTRVGESGPETVILPSGSQILNAQESRTGGGDTFVFNISADNVREFTSLVDMAQSYRRIQRMKGARA